MTVERTMYDPDQIADIPADIVAAARLVSRYFDERNIRGWRLDNCADRIHYVDGANWTPSDETYETLIRASQAARAAGA